MPNVLVNELQIYYELHGKGDLLVLIPGYTCDSSLWSLLLRYFRTRYQVLIFDPRGTGASDCPPGDYTIEQMAKDVLGLMDTLKIEKGHILGHSMGGAVAQWLAYHAPGRVHKLILANTFRKLNYVSSAAERFILSLFHEGVPIRQVALAAMPWLCSNTFLSNPHAVEEYIRIQLKNLHPKNIPGFKSQLAALLAFDSRDWFHHIHQAVLVIGGEDDLLCPREAEALAIGIPKARFVNFPEIGHLVMMEKPLDFSNIVLDFLDDA